MSAATASHERNWGYEGSGTTAELRMVCQRGGAGKANGVKLVIVPMSLQEANEFVRQHHRHHKPVPGAKFCIGISCEGGVCGVAIVGRPVARMLDDGWTLEVNRVATDGTRNANSALYGGCRRAAFALGYKKLVTYTLPTESGESMRGAGWKCIGSAGGGTWNRENRPRVDLHPMQTKIRWEVEA